jgi:uncharacterized protein YdaU (DUF1376 family)
MNYYERHLGDYARDTGHLTMLEHGAYTLLLDRYYASEQGIRVDQVHRITRARTREERAATDAVLREFFTLTDGVWRQARADDVIADYHEGDGDREAKRENAKERQRRARVRRKELFDALREVGVVPAWDTATGELQAILSRAKSQPVTRPVTRDDTAIHTPDTRHQQKELESYDSTAPADAGTVSGHRHPPCPQAEIIAAYHELLPELPPVNDWPDVSATHLRNLWRKSAKRQAVTWWRELFAYVRTSDFLMGEKTDFQASLGWIVKPANFAKVVNGTYDNRRRA